MTTSSVWLLGYAILLLWLGIALSRQVHRASDFFVAGRGLGTGLVFSTLLAANIGAGSTVGATGLGYRDGLSGWWWVGSAGIGSAILAWTIGPRIWRAACAHNLFTVGDYLEHRYNRTVKSTAALFVLLGGLVILAGQYIAVAWILNVTLGFSKTSGCLIAGVVTTTYFSAGGLHSSARVNVLQLAVKLAGFAAVFIYLIYAGTGWEGSLRPVEPAYWNMWGPGLPKVFHYVCLLAPAFMVSPGILQKVFGARDLRAVRLGVGLNAAALLAFAFIPVFMGVVARQVFPGLENTELALPVLLTHSLPPWLGGLLLGAVFSAELSAADAVLFMLTTSLVKDLVQGYFHPKLADRQLLGLSRATAVCCGALGTLFGVLLPSVIAALTVFYTLLTTVLFLPLVAGIYLPRVDGHTALAGMISSVTVCCVIEFATRGAGLWGAPSTALGILTGGVVMLLMMSTGLLQGATRQGHQG